MDMLLKLQKTKNWASLLLICFILTACENNTMPLTSPAKTVDAMYSLTSNLEIPEHFIKDYNYGVQSKQGDEFDVNEYFSILDHLSMEPGYILVYDYEYTGGHGEPILYAAQQTNLQGRLPIEDHIQIDGTPDGYFQYALLQIMGGQFYLYWHSNYNDDTIICNQDQMDRAFAEASAFTYRPVSSFTQFWASHINFEPKVTLKEETVLVKIIVFTKWGGVSRRTYTINQMFPHKILDVQERSLVIYHCSILF